jgi:hypothetical protein
MYVPQELVPWLQQGLKNGRRLEKLLAQQGPLILKHYREIRDRHPKPRANDAVPPPKSLKSNKLPRNPKNPGKSPSKS